MTLTLVPSCPQPPGLDTWVLLPPTGTKDLGCVPCSALPTPATGLQDQSDQASRARRAGPGELQGEGLSPTVL